MFKHMKIGARLGAAFGSVLLLLLAVAAVSLHQLNRLHDRMEDIAQVNDAEARAAVAMRIATNQMAIAGRNLLLVDDVALVDQESRFLRDARGRYDDAERRLAAMFSGTADTTPEQKALFEKAKAMRASAQPLMEKSVEMARRGERQAAATFMVTEVQPHQRRWLLTLGELADLEERLNQEDVRTADEAYRTSMSLLLFLTT